MIREMQIKKEIVPIREDVNVRKRVIKIFLAVAALTFAAGFSAMAAQEEEAPDINTGGETSPAVTASASPPGWLERETLTGDWGGVRPWLKERGIMVMPRLSQFYQGMTSGDDGHDFEYAGKADLLVNAALSKLNFWNGLSLTVHAEYNFGEDVNGRGGTLVPINTALSFPGMEGHDAFDLSSVYLGQTFDDSVFLMFGKINMIDVSSAKRFAGGAGIDSFWNISFAAPPSGLVPPYLLGAILSVRTENATYGLWIYDPEDAVNESGLEDPFNDVTFRGNVEFPVTIAGLRGHQGFVALYSTYDGTDLESLTRLSVPEWPTNADTKKERYYFAYAFDQYLYQSKKNPKEGVGLFGHFGISDGNPTRLHWSTHVGLGGTGLIPGRGRDNWGVGFFYHALSDDLKDALAPLRRLRGESGIDNEQGWEIFYNFSVTPWLTVGADLQIIEPGLEKDMDTAVFCGLRTVITF